MSFIADKQTTDDLNLLGKYKPGSIYSLFNKVKTRGGERLLDDMFRSPLSHPQLINQRSEIFRHLASKTVVFPFTGEQLALIEDYLGTGGSPYWLTTAVTLLRKRLLETAINDKAYGIIREGVQKMVCFLHTCRDLISRFEGQEAPPLLQEKIVAASTILGDRRLPAQHEVSPLSWQKLAALHHLFVHVLQEELTRLLDILYHLDLYITVSKVATDKGFSYAQALPEDEYIFHAVDLRHPCLDRAVGNPVMLDRHKNVLFLTGANMAGKSTFMKAFGIALYLAHMGFPVAATGMVFSIKEGIYSSINVPDNLSMGYSHFYAEVQRVKTIAEEVSRSKSLLVIFDELFKGTNVKDAYDATLAVTAAFAEYRNCGFIISTHIIEVGETLREKYDNLQFVYLPTIMDDKTPRYTYQLKEGLTSDRHGMMIIEQEGILDIIRTRSGKN
jgi:DNA mismatch repair protein MutS